MSVVPKKPDNTNVGHRERLKKRYMDSGFASFSDHEVLELIYFYALPRRDTKPLAKKLLEIFGSIQAVFEATPQELIKFGGLSENSAILFSLMLKSYEVYLTSDDARIELKTPSAVSRYLKKFFVNEQHECFYLICLDSKKRLLSTHLISKGSADETQVYIRNIFEATIKTRATNVILVHNHPDGICQPSKEDIYSTDEVIRSLSVISVKVLDHIIMTNKDFYSFAKNKIIENSI